ncbi:hypothetical protein [Homoserinimonas hongtaonis]|uniref:Nucleotidyltransferase n=1 Tax=Homoserinimonas hongtaonis TaxID=2079791 RepID=A0A2U1T2T1_9MICO|nr:hypothetical protein [Salinibacterium hongtaonis]PWB98182.1 hypothetical protein DF220_10340 [Salinibacterium hongtaonis]
MTIDEYLSDVRAQIEPRKEPLDEARARLALVRKAADSFYGSLRTYRSGSLAVHTMNQPVTDGDGGLILNRNYYPQLGPEGGNEAPDSIVAELCSHLGPIIRETYPNATIHKSKRGPEIHFGDDVNGDDPTVDLVIALNRKVGDGIWIPNLDTGTWEPSHPEQHVELLNSGTAAFRSTRRKIIRLAKAWNKQFAEPGISSFHLSVWALEFVEPGQGVAKGLWTLFDRAASRVEDLEPTPDPAGVSADLKLIKDESIMAVRLRKAADSMASAMDAGTETELVEAMSLVFWKYIEASSTAPLKASAGLVSTGKAVPASALGISVAGATTAGARAYGGRR